MKKKNFNSKLKLSTTKISSFNTNSIVGGTNQVPKSLRITCGFNCTLLICDSDMCNHGD